MACRQALRRKQEAQGINPGASCVALRSVPLGASHGITAIEALVAGAIANGDGAAGIAGGRILHEMLKRPAKLLHCSHAGATGGRAGRGFFGLFEVVDRLIDDLLLLLGVFLERQLGLAGIGRVGFAVAGDNWQPSQRNR